MAGPLILQEAVLSVPEAAERLGVSSGRVRAMIVAGLLEATKIGGRWIVSAASVEHRRESPARPGRMLSPRRAWGLLLLASGHRPGWLSPPEVSRLRGWLKAERLKELWPRLGKRAARYLYRAHPSELERLAQELVRAGMSAAPTYDLDLVPAGEQVDGYVEQRELLRLQKQYALEPSARPNLVLRAVQGPWPFAPGAAVVPIAVAAVDLLESEDARERRAGEELLGKVAR